MRLRIDANLKEQVDLREQSLYIYMLATKISLPWAFFAKEFLQEPQMPVSIISERR